MLLSLFVQKTWLEDQSVNMQTAISRALSPSPTHSGSVDEFSYDPEISGDESDTKNASSSRQDNRMDSRMDDEDSDGPSRAKITRNN